MTASPTRQKAFSPTSGRASRTLIDIPSLADQLRVSPRFVRRLVAEKRVPFLKIGKFIRFDPLDIDRWIETCRRPE